MISGKHVAIDAMGAKEGISNSAPMPHDLKINSALSIMVGDKTQMELGLASNSSSLADETQFVILSSLPTLF